VSQQRLLQMRPCAVTVCSGLTPACKSVWFVFTAGKGSWLQACCTRKSAWNVSIVCTTDNIFRTHANIKDAGLFRLNQFHSWQRVVKDTHIRTLEPPYGTCRNQSQNMCLRRRASPKPCSSGWLWAATDTSTVQRILRPGNYALLKTLPDITDTWRLMTSQNLDTAICLEPVARSS
jgi:hypothetical protein